MPKQTLRDEFPKQSLGNSGPLIPLLQMGRLVNYLPFVCGSDANVAISRSERLGNTKRYQSLMG